MRSFRTLQAQGREWDFRDQVVCFCEPTTWATLSVVKAILYSALPNSLTCLSLPFFTLKNYSLPTKKSGITKIRIMKVINMMQLYRLIYYSQSVLYVSGDIFAHHQEHLAYLQYLVVFTQVTYTPHNPYSLVSTYPRHQQATTWVNTTRYCKYSQVFLMMGEKIARNMQS